ncbi:UDP-3-O-[3-hydroxymyristoyl] N-acetylglucosamine deacetylase [Planctomycetes bacterium Poly30]|uniref:Multifunctional fusion protein n=1 Tax=Saltatorellus ferox TaxID=2528018 RepID=A0A518ERA6_9BACT|nr:UDP-3-O-[3-hydroxymyristoyl] N-acetylglucosamine deacetylase [Planctomycetes bacterium Poly30]
MSRRQHTLRTPVETRGIGLHSGEETRVRITPSPPNHGIEFVRTDIEDAPSVPASIEHQSPKDRRTRLIRGDVEVETVEHFLAAAKALGVDNLRVEMTGSEFPGIDGSALPFLDLLESGGLVEQRAEAKVLRLDEPIFVRDGNATLVALPTDKDCLTLQYVASFEEPGVDSGSYQFDITPETFRKEIAPARTFCLASEVEALQAMGLGKGATRENTVVLGDPDTKLRMKGEPVRHKMLDLLGDLSLLGSDLVAHVIATRSGHSTNAELVRRLLTIVKEKENAGLLQRDSGMDIRRILEQLPHRYPFLLIDRVIEVEGFSRAVGIKNVTINEPFFQGHFPQMPLMPGVLQLEAMAQLAGMLLLRKLEFSGKLAVLWSMDKVKLRGGVTPGDQLRLEVETVRIKGETIKVKGSGSVAGRPVCEADFMFTMIEA